MNSNEQQKTNGALIFEKKAHCKCEGHKALTFRIYDEAIEILEEGGQTLFLDDDGSFKFWSCILSMIEWMNGDETAPVPKTLVEANRLREVREILSFFGKN